MMFDDTGDGDGTSDPAMTADGIDRDRRRLLAGLAATAAASRLPGRAFAQATPGVADDFSDIRHVIVLMMENRSFDHMLGWVPGADGVQAGRSFTNTHGQSFGSYRLPDTWNLLGGDPVHGYDAGRTCFNNGAMDGFLRSEDVTVNGLPSLLQADPFPLGYFSREQVPFYSAAASLFTIGDRYFTGLMGPTWPNRIYMHAGECDRLSTGGTPADHSGLLSTLPTIWDRAAEAGVSARYYYSDAPMTALWGTRLLGISKPVAQFALDALSGSLPAISFIDPAFIGEALGLSNDDHPIADVRNGQAFLNSIYETLRLSPAWANTLLIINYDEWGGFADHVAPPMAPVSAREANLAGGGNDGRLGIRVPFVLIGPRARRNGTGTVVRNQYDPNAILNFICTRFGLAPLGIRAATSGSIASALLPRDQVDTSVPPGFAVPAAAPVILSEAQVRGAGHDHHLDDIKMLQGYARANGFKVLGLEL